jgi:hypothetical protein
MAAAETNMHPEVTVSKIERGDGHHHRNGTGRLRRSGCAGQVLAARCEVSVRALLGLESLANLRVVVALGVRAGE